MCASVCHCYKSEPRYMCVGPSGVLWYAEVASSFPSASIRECAQMDEYSSMTQQGCVKRKKERKTKKREKKNNQLKIPRLLLL